MPSISGCSPISGRIQTGSYTNKDGTYCPLYRAVLLFVSKKRRKNKNLIALYIGLFSLTISSTMRYRMQTYCPLYRAILQLYLPQFYIRISHELPFFNRKFPEKWDNRFDQIPFEAAYLRDSLFLPLLRLRLPHFFLSYIFFAFPSMKRQLIFTRAPITPCSSSTYDSFSCYFYFLNKLKAFISSVTLPFMIASNNGFHSMDG